MKYPTSLFALGLLALMFTGCTRHSSTAAVPKITDLGVIEISDGIPSRHLLNDGRTCVMTPTVLKDGRVKLVTSVRVTNASGNIISSSLAFDAPADQAMSFVFDKSNVISLTLHVSK